MSDNEEPCEECGGKKWLHMGEPFEIQRCDACSDDDDSNAVELHRKDCGCDWPEVDYYFKTWPDIPRQIPRQDSKNRNFAFLYGARDELVESLREEVKVLTNAAKKQESYIDELERENLDLRGKLRVTGDRLTIKSRKVSDIKELRRTADLLVRTVAGMNLQDQPLSVQREVKEALLAAMKALKGELE